MAEVPDLEAFVGLRELMFAEIAPPSDPGAPWRDRAVEWFRKLLENGDGAAFGEVRTHSPASRSAPTPAMRFRLVRS